MAARRARKAPAPALSPEAREVLAAPCRLHAAGSVCDRCPARFETDGYGFPHPQLARGRLRMRLCRKCGKLATVAEWNLDEGVCAGCHPRAARAVEATT